MLHNRWPLTCVCALVSASILVAQNYAPPPSQPPDEPTLTAIAARAAKLDKALGSLREKGVRDPLLGEVEIFHKAATYIVRHNEFYQADAGQWTLAALDDGLLRASQLARGESPWLQIFGHSIVRAYRSRIDGSVQPYSVIWPKDYEVDRSKRYRLDVVLHGRDTGLTEVKFLHEHGSGLASSKDGAGAFVQIDIFGRGNNAYRWAGESDVFEALDHFVAVERLLGRDLLIDPKRIVLRGFSMGGAGTWHLGLHYPDRWCVLGPGAGFTTTHGYVKNLPVSLPAYQEECLHIYDAVDYAENAFDVPVVAYAGADDPQLQAARNIQARLQQLDIDMTLLVAPGLGHRFPPEWQNRAEVEYARFAGPGKGRDQYPNRIRFTTYSVKYPSCSWVEILGLVRHYGQARVDARRTPGGFELKTHNVRVLHLSLPAGVVQVQRVTIDGQPLNARPYLSPAGTAHLYLERSGQGWTAVLPQRLFTGQLRQPQKIHGIQGPIDDAFTTPFLCVRGTGKPWHGATERYARDNLARFQQEWAKFLRGDLPVKADLDVTDDDIANKNLILFGDPASNSLIEQVLPGLPLKWTKDAVTLDAGSVFAAADHVPVLIYPSPLNTGRYVVLNSGHTFHAADFRDTNALLYPRLGDYAVLKLSPNAKDALAVDVAAAGLFDDWWRLSKRP